YLAHPENSEGRVHLLRDHLKGVGFLGREFMEVANPEFAEIAEWSGLLHDLGKYRDEFLDYLLGNREGDKDTHHAVYGAALAYKLAKKCHAWIPVAFAIAAHHAGLHDRHQLLEIFKKYDALNRVPQLVQKFEAELGRKVPETIHTPGLINDKLRLELATRMVFSCLVDADFLDTERHYLCGEERRSLKLEPTELLQRVEKIREDKKKKAEEEGASKSLVETRNQIFEKAIEKAKLPQGFFSLTVPTGGGKTLTSLAFALKHAETHGLRRIIVVIPYLSIIEQTAEEYRSWLDPENIGLVVEHHSATKIRVEDEEESKETESRERNHLVLAAENWDAPIIITTSVQFIESLFANKPSKCRKLHRIARSVVIFDEVQTLPAHLLDPFLSILRELKNSWGVSFLFSTATQPAFRKQLNLENGFDQDEIVEINDKKNEVFQKLQRVRYHFLKEAISLDELAEKLRSEKQVLCVVNTRRQAFELHDKLSSKIAETEKRGLFHLSSSMCAEHRLEAIMEIKRLLKSGEPCRVVSTQLVEAGVDIDFPVVWRATAPLDSIAQSAGRANREGRRERGDVYVFSFEEHRLPSGIYKTGTQIASSMISSFKGDELAVDPDVFAKYFESLFAQTKTGTDLTTKRRELLYREIAEEVKVIQEHGVSVIVPFGGDEGKPMKIVRQIQAKSRNLGKLWISREDFRRLQRFMVNLTWQDFNELKNKGQVHPLFDESNDLWVLDVGSYHEKYGVLLYGSPTDDLLGGI
ncbi:MAG: CRISPR-associated helicase Cas3', partial [Pyrinomonadaceae bacterium]|nr:CRISPR-associated helicase Cas3' [Pyrinomonadaceae bacterium]